MYIYTTHSMKYIEYMFIYAYVYTPFVLFNLLAGPGLGPTQAID
jgi:hypothetical protein